MRPRPNGRGSPATRPGSAGRTPDARGKTRPGRARRGRAGLGRARQGKVSFNDSGADMKGTELALVTQSQQLLADVCRALAEAPDFRLTRRRRDRAEVFVKEIKRAVRECSLTRQEALAAQQNAGEAKLRIERRLGWLLEQTPKQGPGEYQRSHDASVAPPLREYGVTHSESSRTRRLARLPDEAFNAHLAE